MSYVKKKKKSQFNANVKVLARLANTFQEKGSMKKTHLHAASRLRWDLFLRYLNWLQSNNYIESKTDGKDVTYQLTESGGKMFNMLQKFREHIKSN